MIARDALRPLASIPNKEGFVIIGVDRQGREALLTVSMNAGGHYTVPGYSELAGWKLP